MTAITVMGLLYNWPVIAYPVQIRWRNGDFPSSTSSGMTATSRVSPVSLGSPVMTTATANPTGTTVLVQTSSSLSRGDIIAIAATAVCSCDRCSCADLVVHAAAAGAQGPKYG